MDGVETGPPAKRPKKKKTVDSVSNEGGKTTTFSFHPEDEHIQNVCISSFVRAQKTKRMFSSRRIR
jgi:hypothetical protein